MSKFIFYYFKANQKVLEFVFKPNLLHFEGNYSTKKIHNFQFFENYFLNRLLISHKEKFNEKA